MSENNLIPMNERTEEEQRKIARMGGIASGEARRRKRTLKDELILLLETNDNNKKISLALLKKALAGDIQAFTTIRDTIGEKPKEEIENTVKSTIKVDVVDDE